MKMEKYQVISSMHSIVMPGMQDIEIGRDGHLAHVLRMPIDGADPRVGDDFIIHTARSGDAIAYEYRRDLFFVAPPRDGKDAWRQFSRIAGIGHGSLDKIRFCVALWAALRNRGMTPRMSVAGNMVRVAVRHALTNGR